MPGSFLSVHPKFAHLAEIHPGLALRPEPPGSRTSGEIPADLLAIYKAQAPDLQGTFTPDHPEEPTRGTVSPDFRVNALKSRINNRQGRNTKPRRKRRRDFGIGVSSR